MVCIATSAVIAATAMTCIATNSATGLVVRPGASAMAVADVQANNATMSG